MKGILLDSDGDVKIENGSLRLGDSLIQNAEVVLGILPGHLKEDPVLGPNLIRYIRGKSTRMEIQRAVKIHIQRAGISWEEIKDRLNIKINGE